VKIKRLSILLFSLCLVLVFASLSIMIGCSTTPNAPATSAPSTTPVAATTSAAPPATTSAAPAKTVVLKLAPGGLPNAESLFSGIPEWIEEIEKRTEGRVKIEAYYGETLAKGRENVDALESGLADVIFPAPHHQPGKLPLYTLGNVPGLTNDYWAKAMAWYELMSTEKAIQDEFAKYGGRIIGGAYYPPVHLISLTPINSLNEVNGQKVAAMYPSSDLLAKFGAAPLSITPAEQYEALLRKTAALNASPVVAVVDFKLYEVAKYCTTFNLGDRNHALVIREDAFAKLSPADQKIILDFAPEYTRIAYDAAIVDSEPRGTDILKANGVTFITPSDEDSVKLMAVAEELAAAWAAEMDGKGLPGTVLMNRYKELIKQYEAKSPLKK